MQIRSMLTFAIETASEIVMNDGIPRWIMPSYFTTTFLVGVAVWALLSRRGKASRGPTKKQDSIPWAPGALPILGHALKYKRDPSGFFMEASRRLNGAKIFRINLAGRKMIAVIGEDEHMILRKIAMQTESKCSSQKATEDIGFGEMLGRRNVYVGPDRHKRIIKDGFGTDSQRIWKSVYPAVKLAFDEERKSWKSSCPTLDFFAWTRRVMLRASFNLFVGPEFLKYDNEIIEKFMKFQDALEEATAASAVLPRWFALPVVLRPVERTRLSLQKDISGIIKDMMKESPKHQMGFWFKSMIDYPEDRDPLSSKPDIIAELLVGLLFAAHKNPAIGAAQSYLYIREHASKNSGDGRQVLNEAKIAGEMNQLPESSLIRRANLETLRLISHTIGGIRKLQTDITIGPYSLAKGETVALSHITLSLDDTVWTRPQEWILDRDLQLYKDENKFPAFSHGVHACPGQKIARFMMESFLVLLLTKYSFDDLELPKPLPPVSFDRATLAQRKEAILVKVKN